jgi:UDP-N-acetylglucosamine 2-epimerase (non-hydrolysing)/GDP/UDP-N,N'-diacetylbacillosamine 2-epimerase (hydrolysing)
MPARGLRLAAVTGSRADFGLIRWPLHALSAVPEFTIEVVATGTHLAPSFGMTVKEVEAAGFAIPFRIETILAGDGPVAVSKAIALGVAGFADAWAHARPDLVLLPGDRFEIFAAAQAAFIARIPIIHLCGGDVTNGALDDAMRHAISKMAGLHLVTNARARDRLIRMGEQPERIFVVGSPSLDALSRAPLPDRATVERELGFALRARNLLVTFHPATLDPAPAVTQLDELLAAFDTLGPAVGLIITLPNADAEGRALIARLERFATDRAHVALRASLGHLFYLGLMALVDAVVGNSSSGLYEAPSLGKPTVNIGIRQDGRERASSVIDCPTERGAIGAAIARAFGLDCRGTVNPYGDGDASRRIVEILRERAAPAWLLQKTFYDG